MGLVITRLPERGSLRERVRDIEALAEAGDALRIPFQVAAGTEVGEAWEIGSTLIGVVPQCAKSDFVSVA